MEGSDKQPEIIYDDLSEREKRIFDAGRLEGISVGVRHHRQEMISDLMKAEHLASSESKDTPAPSSTPPQPTKFSLPPPLDHSMFK